MSPKFSRSSVVFLLRRYFYSGWAFLIPYLAAYLLYYATGWAVNSGVRSQESGVSIDAAASWVPSLLHVYWVLHAIHVVLAGFALWSWFAERRAAARLRADPDSFVGPSLADAPQPDHSLPVRTQGATLQDILVRLAPWALLALLFYIPGVYLEWPSDPWEHLRRINEWRILDTVGAHSSWHKSAYFIPYSLLSWCVGLRQLFWLDFYYIGICLLLCWQYYRLARACGLGERASMVFVILQALLFGNNIFSFYRYYGISSSIYAQLGAVALTRIFLEWAAWGDTNLHRGDAAIAEPTAGSSHSSGSWRLTPGSLTGSLREHFFIHPSPFSLQSRPSFWHLPTLFTLLSSLFLLLILTAFNHQQGLGIAGLGITAVAVWRLIVWKRASGLWLIGAAVVLSITIVLWFPHHSAVDDTYRPQGWLTSWYGFNLFSFRSPAFQRSLQILGVFGVVNLVIGLVLVSRNHVAGWLTITPIMILCLPCFALPLALVVTSDNPAEDILIFHRLLLGVPIALALVVALSSTRSAPFFSTLSHVFLLAAFLLAGLLLPAGPMTYNRFWHTIQSGPDDLNLRPLVAASKRSRLAAAECGDILDITPPLGGRAREAFVPHHERWQWRQIPALLNASEIKRALGWINVLPFLAAKPQYGFVSDKVGLGIPPTVQRNIVDLSAPWTVWSSDSGHKPELSLIDGGLVASNVPGSATHAFARNLVPLDHGRRYQLTVTVRQSEAIDAVNYLAVAWHNRDGALLVASEQAPKGAGNPLGWTNGAYSYFGLVGEPAPADWSTYSITFGLGELAEIPAQAAYLRAGALLNYMETPQARIQLARVQVLEKPLPERVIFSAPDFVTPSSIAGQLSGHWNPAKVHIDYVGTTELRAAAALVRNP